MTGLASAGAALWLGLLAGISPCPLATNLAAVSYIGREVARPRRVLGASLAYALGRVVVYAGLGAVLSASLLSLPGVAGFLQGPVNRVLAPVLVVIGLVLLAAPRLPVPSWSPGNGLARRLAGGGIAGAGLLGVLFALAFCPSSAGLFFGSLLPLAVGADSRVLVPAAFGVGTALPTATLATALALGAGGVGRSFDRLVLVEKWARRLSGAAFVGAGLYVWAAGPAW